MALYGYEQIKPDPNAGFVPYKPPRRKPPKSTFHKPRPKAPVRPKVVDPLAPLTDAQLQSRAQSLTSAQLGPILDQIRRIYAERSAQGEAAIRGTTSALGNLFAQAAPQTAAAYGQATQATSQVNSELANRLNAVAQNLGSEVGQKLALQDAGAPVTNQTVGTVVGTGQGVSNANFAKGAAEVSRLAAEGAHAGEYAAKLPGIAALTGMQHSKELEAQLNHQLQDDLANATGNAQKTFTDLYLHLVDQEWQKTLARTSGQFKSAQAEADAKYKAQQAAFKRAELSWKKAKAKADRQEKAREANQRAATARKNAQTAAQRAAEQKRHNKQTEAQARANAKKKGKGKGGVNSTTGIPH